MVSRSDGGGADAAEGPDAAGLSDTFGYIFVLGNTFFVLAVCLRKIISNFLKFSQICTFFANFCKKIRGARCGRSVGYIFSIGNFGGKKIISNFLGIHFYVLAMAENYLKFSQILKFSQKFFNFFSFFSKIVSICPRWSAVVGGYILGGVCRDTCLVCCCFWAHVKYISELCVVGLIRKCPCCGECFVLSSQEMIASDKHYQQFQVINTISIDKHHVRKHCDKTL